MQSWDVVCTLAETGIGPELDGGATLAPLGGLLGDQRQRSAALSRISYDGGRVPLDVLDCLLHGRGHFLEVGVIPKDLRRLTEPIHEGHDDGGGLSVPEQDADVVDDGATRLSSASQVEVGVRYASRRLAVSAPALLELFGDLNGLGGVLRDTLASQDVHEVVPVGTGFGGSHVCPHSSVETFELWLALSQPLLLDRLFIHLLRSLV